MPADPIINDHYGDVLWKNGNKIQARYFWNYVLNLKETEKDMKENIKDKNYENFPIVCLDFGIKQNILRNLKHLNFNPTILPAISK